MEKAFGLTSSSSKVLPTKEESSSSGSEMSSESTSPEYDWFMDNLNVKQSAPAQPCEHAGGFIEHMDESIGKPSRLYSNGSCVLPIQMTAGSDGFMWATWFDGSTSKTEVPVLLHQAPVAIMKKPSACPSADLMQDSELSDHLDDADDEAEKPAGVIGNAKQPVVQKSVVKKSASSKVKKLCSEIIFDFPADRFNQFPKGCPKCKNKPGCTKSCWVYRLKLNR